VTVPSARRVRMAGVLALAGACAIMPLTASAAARPSRAAVIPVGGGAQVAVDPVTGTAFAATGNPADNVDVIDMATGTVTATIPTGAVTLAVAVNPATGLVYAGHRADDSVSVISPATGTVTATITGLAGEPYSIAADPVTDMIYVGLYERGTPAEIAVIDGATSTLATTITLPASTPGGTGGNGIAVDPDTGSVYLSFCGTGCGADIIDPATGTVTGQLSGLLAIPPDLAVDPATSTVYVAGGHGVTAYSAATGARLTTTDLGSPVTGIAVNPAAGTLYVPAENNTVYLLDATSLATIGALPARTVTAIAADPATGTLALNSDGSLSLVTLHAPAITSTSHATLTAGHPAAITLAATGTPPPAYTNTGRLPAGLTLTSGGLLAGTPGRRTGGTYPLTITAANGVAHAATQRFTLTIRQAPVFTSPARAWFKAGARHTFTIRASAYPAAAITEHGKLPPGLRLAIHPGGTATLTGTPKRSDRGKTFRIRITASNHVGQHATQTLTIHISGSR